MIETKLVEGVNIGKLPDPFISEIKNYKIFKVKGDDSLSSLNEEYRRLLDAVYEMKIEKDVNVGATIKGKISSINKKEILVDFGYKDYIYVEYRPKDENVANMKQGDEIEIMVTEIIDNPYCIKGSFSELLRINVQEKIKTIYNEDGYFMATITESKPAGFMLKINLDGIFLDGFMPNTLAGANKLTDDQSNTLVGKEMEVMLETLQQDKGIYVVSRKKYLQTHKIPEMFEKIRKEFDEDYKMIRSGKRQTPRVYEGFVTGTTPFGVFIEIIGYDGLTTMIHKYNVNPEWQDKWNSISPGMIISFYIKELSVKKERIISTQILRESLWDSIKVGKVLKGKVNDVKSYGALVQLDDETVGLIQNAHMKENVKINSGDSVEVKVVSVIRDDRKIYLSLLKKL